MSSIRFIDEHSAQVTKAFQKKAVIYGTEEFKLWHEYKRFYPGAHMEVKKIKKNPLKQNSTKNLTYENMEVFIREQSNADELLKNFKSICNKSKVQANPYRYVLAWFLKEFENHNDYIAFFDNLEMTRKKKEEKVLASSKASTEAQYKTVSFDSCDEIEAAANM